MSQSIAEVLRGSAASTIKKAVEVAKDKPELSRTMMLAGTHEMCFAFLIEQIEVTGKHIINSINELAEFVSRIES